MIPNYINYSSISIDEFVEINNKIISIEKEVDKLCNDNGFFRHDSHSREYLGLDYIYSDGTFDGNIGFGFNDDKTHSYNFYVLKSFDEPEMRKIKKEAFKILRIEEILLNYKTLFIEGIRHFNNWKYEDLNEVVYFTL